MKKKKISAKIILAFIIGFFASIASAYATILFNSNEITFDNSACGLTSTTVQGAIDELNGIANNKTCVPSSNPTYYALGEVTTSSTTNYSSLGKKVFVGLYNNNDKAICILRSSNNTLICFKADDYSNQSKYAKEVFSGITCNETSNVTTCDTSSLNNVPHSFQSPDFLCTFMDSGVVRCTEISSGKYCVTGGNSTTSCNY